MKYEKIKVKTNDNQELNLAHFSMGLDDNPVLFIHGSIENGKIFYSENGKGLAPYLAQNGHRCFVADLRGRGESLPLLSKDSGWGQSEIIDIDLPTLITYVKEVTGKQVSIVTHSWGGVLINSCLIKYPRLIEHVSSMVHVATKRSVKVWNPERLFYISLMWNKVAPVICKLKGHLPKNYYGPDGESQKSISQCIQWVKGMPWVDSDDGFDYFSNARKVKLPKTLYLTGKRDRCLGHKDDVLNFINECEHSDYKFMYLSKKAGHKEDYDHISIVTSRNCESDHFPDISKWLFL